MIVAVALLVLAQAAGTPGEAQPPWVQLAIVLVGGLVTLGAAYMGIHAKKRGEKVDQSAVLFEGYDELVTHLRDESAKNTKRIDHLEAELEKCHLERVETKALVGRLLKHFGLPLDFDPPPEPTG